MRTYTDIHFLFNEHGVTTWTTPEFFKEVFKTELFQYNYYLPHTKTRVLFSDYNRPTSWLYKLSGNQIA